MKYSTADSNLLFGQVTPNYIRIYSCRCFIASLILLVIFLSTYPHPYRIKYITNKTLTVSLENVTKNPFSRRYSKFRCTGDENNITAMSDRLCLFNNLCYDTTTKDFNYFQRSPDQPKPLFYDSSKGMLYQFHPANHPSGFVSLSSDGSYSWAPIVTNRSFPNENVTRLTQLHSLVKIRFGGGNIGHGLWEDFGSISYSMERLNLFDKDLVIVHIDSLPRNSLMLLYEKFVVPALTPNPLVELENYTKSFRTKFICFDRLMVGGQLVLFLKVRQKESHGREALFYNWRSKILRFNGFDPNVVVENRQIILTNKSESIWTRNGARQHRAIANLNETFEFIRKTYPDVVSEVVEWQKLAFDKQIGKLLKTSILITPCGGISTIIPFLPDGGHVIVMDYFVSTSNFGFTIGQSASMDGAFLNHIPHVQKQYYQIYGKNDFRFDFVGATDTREDASILINSTRLRLLIDKALDEIN